jgi:hypothetical protein
MADMEHSRQSEMNITQLQASDSFTLCRIWIMLIFEDPIGTMKCGTFIYFNLLYV